MDDKFKSYTILHDIIFSVICYKLAIRSDLSYFRVQK